MADAPTVSGVVTFTGERPEPIRKRVNEDPYCGIAEGGEIEITDDVIVNDGKLANAFIYISSGLEGKEFPVPTKPALLDQKECQFVPHVMGVRTGQPIRFRNSDSTLHNVHAITQKNKSFNIGQPSPSEEVEMFNNQEVMIQMTCDVHSWMRSYVAVLDHPSFAVSDSTGHYSFAAPPGNYTVTLWHERLGKVEKQIEVKQGEDVTLDFEVK